LSTWRCMYERMLWSMHVQYCTYFLWFTRKNFCFPQCCRSGSGGSVINWPPGSWSGSWSGVITLAFRVRIRKSGLRIRASRSDQKEMFTDPQQWLPQSSTGNHVERFLTCAQITVHAPFLAVSEVKMRCFISNDTSLQLALNTKTENQFT
jgi:hypothetical protein